MKLKYIAFSLLFCTFISHANTENFQTNLVKDIRLGMPFYNSSIYTGYRGQQFSVITLNDKIFFLAYGDDRKLGLWQSDGTSDKTNKIIDMDLGGENGTHELETSIGNHIVLVVRVGGKYELKKINSLTGESETIMTSNGMPFPPGAGEGISLWRTPFKNVTNINDELFFSFYTEEGNYQPWKSDGTVDGTHAISSLSFDNDINKWAALNDNLIFSVGHSSGKLWVSEGANAEIAEISGDFSVIDSNFIKMNDAIFFIDNTPENEASLWKYNGTDVSLIKKINTDISKHSTELININDTLYFSVKKKGRQDDQWKSEAELWKSDGTATGTSLIKTDVLDAGKRYHLTNLNGSLFFNFVSSSTLQEDFSSQLKTEFWKSNGTVEGTVKVNDTTFKGIQYPFSSVNNTLLFFAEDESHGSELWRLKNELVEEVAPPTCATGVDPQTIQAGEGTALWWWSDSALTANINQGIGSINLPTDFKWIYPEETTTYTVTATGADETTATCDATIVVEGQTEVNPPICEMGADPQIIRPGQGTALWWWSDNVSSASIDNDIGSVKTMTDYKWFYPTQTATYTMAAVNENGVATSCKTTIEVD